MSVRSTKPIERPEHNLNGAKEPFVSLTGSRLTSIATVKIFQLDPSENKKRSKSTITLLDNIVFFHVHKHFSFRPFLRNPIDGQKAKAESPKFNCWRLRSHYETARKLWQPRLRALPEAFLSNSLYEEKRSANGKHVRLNVLAAVELLFIRPQHSRHNTEVSEVSRTIIFQPENFVWC